MIAGGHVGDGRRDRPDRPDDRVQEQVKEDGFDNEKNDRRRRYKGGDFAEIGGGRHERPVHAGDADHAPRGHDGRDSLERPARFLRADAGGGLPGLDRPGVQIVIPLPSQLGRLRVGDDLPRGVRDERGRLPRAHPTWPGPDTRASRSRT